MSRVADRVAKPPSDELLPKFVASLDPAWIEEALAATGTATIRRRRLPAEQVVWLVIGMCLFRDQSMRELVSMMDLALPGSRGIRVTASSMASDRGPCKATPVSKVLIVALLLGACSNKTRTVSCHTPDVMCHEWHDADEALVEEVKGPICHKHGEVFIDGVCSRGNVFGVCTQQKETTIWYRATPYQFDDAAGCLSRGGTWSKAP